MWLKSSIKKWLYKLYYKKKIEIIINNWSMYKNNIKKVKR